MLGLVGFGRAIAVFMLAAFLGGCTGNITDRDVDKHTVSVGEVRRLMDLQQRKGRDDFILMVDPRPESEYAKGHIPGARNLMLSQVKPKDPIDKSIDRYKNIIVYGYDPASAAARGMTKRLMGNGYDNVAFYSGGVYQWTATGGTLMTSEPKQAQVNGGAGAAATGQ
jgi:rhodanese-related sulfurtransferase